MKNGLPALPSITPTEGGLLIGDTTLADFGVSFISLGGIRLRALLLSCCLIFSNFLTSASARTEDMSFECSSLNVFISSPSDLYMFCLLRVPFGFLCLSRTPPLSFLFTSCSCFKGALSWDEGVDLVDMIILSPSYIPNSDGVFFNNSLKNSVLPLCFSTTDLDKENPFSCANASIAVSSIITSLGML